MGIRGLLREIAAHLRLGRPCLQRWSVLPWVVLTLSISLSYAMFSAVRSAAHETARVRFEREVTDLHSIITRRLRSYSDVLHSLRALFAAVESVDRRRFHDFVASLQLKERYPGFVALNYAQRVSGADRPQFEEEVRRDASLTPGGYPNFTIKPSGTRSEYFVIVYIEPMEGYEFAHGLDLGANAMAEDPTKVAAAVLEQRDTGRLVASAQRLRVPRRGEPVFLAMRLAVYRRGMPTSTVDERRRAYLGSVGAGFDVEYLLKDAPSEESNTELRVQLYDAGAKAQQSNNASRLLFDSAYSTSAQPRSPRELVAGELDLVLPVEAASRIWQLRYSAQRAAVMSRTDKLLPPLTLAGGLTVGLLLFGVLYSLAHARAGALALAEKMTEDLRESKDQLQASSKRLVEIQESDRRQFARELHDRVGQNLTAISISLKILRSQLRNDVSAVALSRIDDMAKLVEAATRTTEDIMAEMRPQMLDDYGLLAALQWYGSEFERRFGIIVNVEGDQHVVPISSELSIGLFRIVQEALNNVVKHAHATRVVITMAQTASGVAVSVADNGVGYPDAQGSSGKRRMGLGWITMRERAQSLGGKLEVTAPSQGRGTIVTVTVPS